MSVAWEQPGKGSRVATQNSLRFDVRMGPWTVSGRVSTTECWLQERSKVRLLVIEWKDTDAMKEQILDLLGST